MYFMKIKEFLFLFFVIGVLLSSLNAQQVDDDSIRYHVKKFLLKNDDGTLLDDHCFYDFFNDTCVLNFPKSDNTIGLYKISSFQSPRYIHLLLIYDNKYYIIDMRRPLSTIINNINDHSKQSPLFIGDIIAKCMKEIKKLHQFNWEMNVGIKKTEIDENGNFIEEGYDPEKW